MDILQKIEQGTIQALKTEFDAVVSPDDVNIQETRREFEGQWTVVCFPFAKKYKLGAPDKIAEKVGMNLVDNLEEVAGFEAKGGFLNLSLSGSYWSGVFNGLEADSFVKTDLGKDQKVMVEFSSPNTNKPLHLGHLRNNFLGDSVCRILEANGFEVIRTCVYNDRGIAICKSMLMYQMFGNNETPESSGKKGDYLVVDYYVRFRDELDKQVYATLLEKGMTERDASLVVYKSDPNNPEATKKELKPEIKSARTKLAELEIDLGKIEYSAPVNEDAREMLRKWEAGDEETVALWKQMNSWVYEGFNQTYDKIGVKFDVNYYESDTYLVGNQWVDYGLEKGVFFKKEDGSVWIDLTDEGLDEKAVRRKDGTAMYITQDIGTAKLRYDDYKFDKHAYVVADEQNYHFTVLFLILKKLGWDWYKGMHHLAYGMVDLPTGKMKTREGTSVDADDLIEQVKGAVKQATTEQGKTEGMNEDELQSLYHKLAIAALKLFILKVEPRKRMVYNPEESVALQGDTGPFVQYSYARSQSIGRKATTQGKNPADYTALQAEEVNLIFQILKYPEVLKKAAENYDPSAIANFLVELAKVYNRFHQGVHVLKSETEEALAFRLRLCEFTANVLRAGAECLGIEMPERM